MRKTSGIIVTGIVLLLAASGFALGQGVKIGFVDSREVLYGTAEGKQQIEALNSLRQEKQQEFDSRTEELQKLQEEYAAQQRTLNPEARAERERLIEQKQVQLKRFQEDAQAEIEQRQNEILQRMSERAQNVIDEFAEQNGYVAIFMRDQTQAYVAPSLDVTKQIIALYDQRHPLSGGGSPAGDTSAPPANNP